MKLLLFLSSSLLTLLLVVHSVKARGVRTTFAFFVSAFLFGVIRGNSVAFLAGGESSGPYIFSDALISIGRAELPAVVGWIFSVYLSWTLAEGFLRSRPALAGSVFPLSAFAILAMGCFSDAVETSASGVGWWRWNILTVWTPLLPGGTHLFGIVEWMSVGLDFLVPFLLFRTPKGGRSLLAWGALLLYPVHWACHWRYAIAPGVPHAYEFYHALIAFSVLVFPLLENPRFASPIPASLARGVALLPGVALGGMFAVLAGVDLGVLRSPELLISLFPLAVMAAGSALGEKAALASALIGAPLAFGMSLAAGAEPGVALLRMIPPLVPAAFLLVYGAWMPKTRSLLFRQVYAAALLLAALLVAWGMFRGKADREELSRLVAQAQASMEAEDFQGAEAAAKKALALKPNLILVTKLLANLYGGTGRMAQAWEYASKSLAINPADYEAHRLAGQVLRGQGRFAQAAPYYERALLLNPADAESARGLADCYSRQGRYADAIAPLRGALSRRPGDVELSHLLGALLVQTGDFRGAHRIVAELLRRNPDDAGAHLLMAYIHAAGGNAAAARAAAERSLQLNPGDPQARGLLDSLPR